MDATRSTAYGELLRLLDELGPAKLHAAEQQRVREAADTLILAPDWDSDARAARSDMEDLADTLVEADRWEVQTAERLVATVSACGPAGLPRLTAHR